MTFLNRPEKLRKLQTKLRVLGKKHSLKIIAFTHLRPTYIKRIADETRIPYTTVQSRIRDLETAGLIRIKSAVDKNTGKAIQNIRVERFNFVLDINIVSDLVYGSRSIRYRNIQ